MQDMPNETTTGHDAPRPVATSSDYTLSIEEVAERYAKVPAQSVLYKGTQPVGISMPRK
jgi:hypothetical protein